MQRPPLLLNNTCFPWLGCACSYLIASLLISCANQVPPTGGPKDEAPPKVERTEPAHETLFFNDDKVTIYFDEFIRPATYGKEIFISPLPPSRPKVVLLNKKVKIKFNEPLRENTTYVITITEVRDQNENNTMTESYSLAFSTGAVLDSMKMDGVVYDKVIGQPVEGLTVMLFDADSVQEHDFFKKRPAYISKTTKNGSFSFQNLRNTDFKVYGVTDVDRSNTYSQPTEVIALSQDPRVSFIDSTSSARDTLYAFLPDGESPVVLGYNWINDSVIISKFSEGILPERLFLTMADTLGENPRGISQFSYLGGKEHELILLATRADSLYSSINFVAVSDSLGNTRDSLMRIVPERTRKLEDVLVRKPTYLEEEGQFELFFPGILSAADTASIFLSDTFRTPIDTTGLDSLQVDSALATKPFVPGIALEVDAFRVRILPRQDPEPKVPYLLNIRGELLGTPDTTYQFSLQWPDPKAFGTLEGVLKLPDEYQGPVVVEFGPAKGPPVRVVYDTIYQFSRLKENKYKVRVIFDADSNRVWTPGSLVPYRLPERVYLHPGEVAIRANWEFEDYEIEVDLNKVQAPTDSIVGAAPGAPGAGPSGSGQSPKGNNRNED